MKIFHVIKRFLHLDKASEAQLPDNRIGELSRWRSFVHWLLIFSGGGIMAMAFPPLNFSFAAFIALAILWLEVRNRSALSAAFGGWVWGMGYSLIGFFWLREIHAAVPWMLMFVLGFYYIPAGLMAALANRWILLPDEVRKQGYSSQSSYRDFPLWRQMLWCLVMASTMVIVEYLRCRVLPWNYVGNAFYRNAVMMQIVRVTGVYGLTMLVALFNAALVLALLTVARKDPERSGIYYRRPWPLLIVLLLMAMNMAYGIYSLRERRREYAGWNNFVRLTLVQGNLSQRRMGGPESALEALYTYDRLTRTQQGVPTDLVVWPETAVNYPLRGAAGVCSIYREFVQSLARDFKSPLLLGSLEFDQTTDPVGTLNSAILTDERNILSSGYIAQYDKVHLVPFGEYIPMRSFLPEFIVRLIDMNRDLTPGKSLDPIKLNDRIKLGVNICFEDVFTYISRSEVMRGANLLLVITNDAWYPSSSEPEQHLANSVARAIENNLPMVRCGNDSASCLISPGGEIIWSMAGALMFEDGQPFRRGAGAATITVRTPAPGTIKPTFYSRFGDWIVLLSTLCVAAALLRVLQGRLSFTASLRK